MTAERFHSMIANYPRLRFAVVGDFCLDRYLEIDPGKPETSRETGLPVYNVVNVRSQPGGAGTILNNLAALGVGDIFPVGIAGEDGEGFELVRALQARANVNLEHFLQIPERRTFTYCKPLVREPGQAPRELNRFDTKNWTPTPSAVQSQIVDAVQFLAAQVDALILLDQVDIAETGVVTNRLLQAVRALAKQQPDLLILADSRRGLRGYPPVIFKMNGVELSALTGLGAEASPAEIQTTVAALARAQGREVFVTLSERGILGAASDGVLEEVPALPVRGPIDIVGAGDAVTANLAVALAAGATLRETIEIANAAASVVIHQLGTTGTASVEQIAGTLAGYSP